MRNISYFLILNNFESLKLAHETPTVAFLLFFAYDFTIMTKRGTIMWQLKTFEQLTTHELYQIYKLRCDVFIVEQACAYPEVDEHDLICYHGMKWEKDQLVAYYRLIPGQPHPHLGRVVVNPNFRSNGQGRELVTQAIQESRRLFPEQALHAQAQAYLQSFYESFGFTPISKVYLEDDIPHLDMILD